MAARKKPEGWVDGDLLSEEQAIDFLTLREYRFAHAYLATNFNGTEAMRRVLKLELEDDPNCVVPKRIREIAWELKSRGMCRGYIKFLVADCLDDLSASKERTLREIVSIGFSNIGDLLDENGDIRSFKELPREVLAAVQSIDIETIGKKPKEGEPNGILIQAKKLKMANKHPALELLCKYHGILVDKKEVTVTKEEGLSPELAEVLRQNDQNREE